MRIMKMNFKEYQQASAEFASYASMKDLIVKEIHDDTSIPEFHKKQLIDTLSSITGYKYLDKNPFYSLLGLGGEVGEVLEKIKKIVRNKLGSYDENDRLELTKELGDVLWYISDICTNFGIDLNEVAECNINKLADRVERGVLHSTGDNR